MVAQAVLAVHHAAELLHGQAAHLLHVLMDGGEGQGAVAADGDVVVADEADGARDGDAGGAQGLQGAQGEPVGGAKEGVKAPAGLQGAGDGLQAALEIDLANGEAKVVQDGGAHGRERAAVALVAVHAGGEVALVQQDGHAAAAAAQDLVGGLVAAAKVVGLDDGGALGALDGVAVDVDGGHAGPAFHGGAVAGDADQAADHHGPEGFQVGFLLAGRLVGVADEDRIAARPEVELDPEDDLGEVLVDDVGHDHAHQRQGVGAKPPGHGVGHEARLQDGGAHALRGLGREAPGLVDDPRDGRGGVARHFGNRLDGDAPGLFHSPRSPPVAAQKGERAAGSPPLRCRIYLTTARAICKG